MSHRILVVDDQASFCRHIRAFLEGEGYEVHAANAPDEALESLAGNRFDVLLVDMKMPQMSGLELFQKARNIDGDLSCIIMTAFGSISSAVEAIKQGVSDYVQKPFEPESLLMAVQKTLRERAMLQEIKSLRQEVNQRYSFGNIVGKNAEMRKIYDLIEKVAPTDARVFITGETGVGKELVAKAIHFNSPRRDRPFVAINCGALTETLLETELFGHEKGAFTGATETRPGKFEYARGGTVFLDEIGEISPAMQVKLLRVLQEKQFERVGGNKPIRADVRVIAATNQDIKKKLADHEFRMDLFYRLNVVPIHIPPLRERKEDIPALVAHFIKLLNKNLGKNVRNISSQAMTQLMQYHWPGNVRELENVLERHLITTDGDTIERIVFDSGIPGASTVEGPACDPADLEVPFPVARSLVVRRFERAYVRAALERFGGNVTEASKNTGIHPRTFWRKIKEYGLDRSRFQP
ncbi:MAG: sigma-54 dependent transcriptional regulator [Deferrisomatales bacterium]